MPAASPTKKKRRRTPIVPALRDGSLKVCGGAPGPGFRQSSRRTPVAWPSPPRARETGSGLEARRLQASRRRLSLSAQPKRPGRFSLRPMMTGDRSMHYPAWPGGLVLPHPSLFCSKESCRRLILIMPHAAGSLDHGSCETHDKVDVLPRRGINGTATVLRGADVPPGVLVAVARGRDRFAIRESRQRSVLVRRGRVGPADLRSATW